MNSDQLSGRKHFILGRQTLFYSSNLVLYGSMGVRWGEKRGHLPPPWPAKIVRFSTFFEWK